MSRLLYSAYIRRMIHCISFIHMSNYCHYTLYKHDKYLLYNIVQENLTHSDMGGRAENFQDPANPQITRCTYAYLTKPIINVILWTSCLSCSKASSALAPHSPSRELSETNTAPKYSRPQIKCIASPARQITPKSLTLTTTLYKS